MTRLTLLLLLLMLSPASAGALNVFTCEPEWAALVQELTAANTEISTATTAYQDPHRLQARPSLIAAVRNADLIVCTGADLEIGWLPLLLRRAGNPEIQIGKPGHFLAAEHVRRLEIPRRIDRAQGDVHPQGNPHIHLNPRNVARVAKALGDRLAEVDPVNAEAYGRSLNDFLRRWSHATQQWEQRAQMLRGMRLASHHRSFSYLADWLKLNIVATLESKPGIPPSGAQLALLLQQLTPEPPAAVIRAPFEDKKPSLWLAGRLSIPDIRLPYTIGGTKASQDLFSLYDETLRLLEEQLP